MSTVFVINQNYTLVECCKCHVTFAMPEATNDRLRKTHDEFFCTFGHSQSYRGKTEEDKLREQVADLEVKVANRTSWQQRESERADAMKRKCIALRGTVTRLQRKAVLNTQ